MRGVIVVLVGVLLVSACDIEKHSGPSGGPASVVAPVQPEPQPEPNQVGALAAVKKVARRRCC